MRRLDEAAVDLVPPPVLMLRRKTIRMHGVNRGVALYFADQLGRYISIPFGMPSVVTEDNNDPSKWHPAWDSILKSHYNLLRKNVEDIPKKNHKEKASVYSHMREIKSQYSKMARQIGRNDMRLAEDAELLFGVLESITPPEELDEASRWKIVKARIRNGKVQRRRKVATVPGFTFRNKGGTMVLIRMSTIEKIRRKIGARRAKIKRRSKRSRIQMKTKRAMMRRRGMGL